jgi:hypothetical protein
MNLKFELLCIDLEHKVKFRKPENFVKALFIIESLWNGNPAVNEDRLSLEDSISQIKLSVQCPLPPRRNQKRVENWDKFSNFKNKRQCARVATPKMSEWPS